MSIEKLSVIIPVYNEENTVQAILKRVGAVALVNDIEKEIVIINDGSTDGTEGKIQEFLQHHSQLDIRYLSQHKNQGKGAAIHRGIREASGEYLIIQDADLEYDPEEYNLLLRPVLHNQAQVVYGSRFISGQPRRVLFFWHSIGNNFLTFLTNMFTNLNLTDMETCYKLLDSRIAKQLKLCEKRFGFEPEVTAKIARIQNVRIYEVGISYHGRGFNEGKKINWRDGFRAIYCIVKYGLFRIS